MGKKPLKEILIPRAVLDTNVFISALLFSGETSRLVTLWQNRFFHYLLSRPVLEEYIRLLSYPKFQLTQDEIKTLIQEELIAYVEVIPEKAMKVPALKDRDDEKFLKLAILGKAKFLVTGDKGLLNLRKIKDCLIIPPSDFLKFFHS